MRRLTWLPLSCLLASLAGCVAVPDRPAIPGATPLPGALPAITSAGMVAAGAGNAVPPPAKTDALAAAKNAGAIPSRAAAAPTANGMVAAGAGNVIPEGKQDPVEGSGTLASPGGLPDLPAEPLEDAPMPAEPPASTPLAPEASCEPAAEADEKGACAPPSPGPEG